MGVQIDLPLTPAERDALLTHCNNTAATVPTQSTVNNGSVQSLSHDHRQPDPIQQQGTAYHQGQGQNQGQTQGRGSTQTESQNSEANRASGRSHGEILYQYQQQQYHLHQERISEAQMQQAYYSLSVASQDAQNSQTGGSFEELCQSSHGGSSSSLGIGAAGSSRTDRGSGGRSRDVTSSQLQQHVKEENKQSHNHQQYSQTPAQGHMKNEASTLATSLPLRRGDQVDIGSNKNSNSYTSNSNAAYGTYDQPQQDSSSYNHYNSGHNSNSTNSMNNRNGSDSNSDRPNSSGSSSNGGASSSSNGSGKAGCSDDEGKGLWGPNTSSV